MLFPTDTYRIVMTHLNISMMMHFVKNVMKSLMRVFFIHMSSFTKIIIEP